MATWRTFLPLAGKIWAAVIEAFVQVTKCDWKLRELPAKSHKMKAKIRDGKVKKKSWGKSENEYPKIQSNPGVAH